MSSIVDLTASPFASAPIGIIELDESDDDLPRKSKKNKTMMHNNAEDSPSLDETDGVELVDGVSASNLLLRGDDSIADGMRVSSANAHSRPGSERYRGRFSCVRAHRTMAMMTIFRLLVRAGTMRSPTIRTHAPIA